MSFKMDSGLNIEACLESYEVISMAPATSCDGSPDTILVRTPPRILRSGRVRAFSSVLDRAAVFYGSNQSIVSQRSTEDALHVPR